MGTQSSNISARKQLALPNCTNMLLSWEATRPNKRSGGEGPRNSHTQGLALLFPDWEMLVGHLIPLCFNFPSYEISVFPSLNYSASELAAWLTPPCPWGKVLGTPGCAGGSSGAYPGTGHGLGEPQSSHSSPTIRCEI